MTNWMKKATARRHTLAKAIGAAELMNHLDGNMTLEETREKIVTLTRQYAKRQRSWLRARMKDWRWQRCH